MTKIEAAALITLAVFLVLGFGAWKAGREHSEQEHCNTMLGGIAVKEGTSGRTVCVKRDSILKIYGEGT